TPATNTWASLAPMPTGRGGLAAATGPDGRIYAIGGVNNNNVTFGTVEAYTPATNTWTAVASMPGEARKDFAAATGPARRTVAIGGATPQGDPLARVQAYT